MAEISKIENLFQSFIRGDEFVSNDMILEGIDNLDSTRDLLSLTSSFADFRRSLIRAGRIDDLTEVLMHVKGVSQNLGDAEVDTLMDILLFNRNWHSGELEECQAFIEKGELYNNSYSDLFRVFASYYYNTAGNFTESLLELNSINLQDNANRLNVEHFLGVDLECVRATWRIWNRTETLDYNGIEEDLGYVDKVVSNPEIISNKSSSLIFLAIGVFYLSHNNFSKSKIYLDLACEHSVGEGKAWLPRIQSALSVCEHKLGKFSLSAEFLDSSVSNLGSHFGPSGWMIRVVQSLNLHNRKEEADLLLSKIVEETERKGEKGYEVWSKIHLAEQGNFTGKSQELFSMAEDSGMRRACQYMLANNLV